MSLHVIKETSNMLEHMDQIGDALKTIGTRLNDANDLQETERILNALHTSGLDLQRIARRLADLEGVKIRVTRG